MMYHALRLGEGTGTRPLILPNAGRPCGRIGEAGMELAHLVEPLGPEHADEEIADVLLAALEAGAKVCGVMARSNVPGTPYGGAESVSDARLREVAAVIRLCGGVNTPHVCVHPPVSQAVAWGANVVVVGNGGHSAGQKGSRGGLAGLFHGTTPARCFCVTAMSWAARRSGRVAESFPAHTPDVLQRNGASAASSWRTARRANVLEALWYHVSDCARRRCACTARRASALRIRWPWAWPRRSARAMGHADTCGCICGAHMVLGLRYGRADTLEEGKGKKALLVEKVSELKGVCRKSSRAVPAGTSSAWTSRSRA